MKINPPSSHLFYNCVTLEKTNFQFQFFLVYHMIHIMSFIFGTEYFLLGLFLLPKKKEKGKRIWSEKESGSDAGPNREERSEAQVPEEIDHKKSHTLGNLFIKERMHSDAKGPLCLLLLIKL